MANATAGLALAALATLADPTRRAIVEQLATLGPSPVGRLAERLPVTRSAVSQHLATLKEAGLVCDTAEGTRRIYRLDPRGIGALRNWLDQLWSEALGGFAALADAETEINDARKGRS